MAQTCDLCRIVGGFSEPAAGLWRVDGGCIALPGVEDQNLCIQHEVTCEPLGPLGATLVYSFIKEDYPT